MAPKAKTKPKKTALSLRETLLKKSTFVTESVHVPLWDETVFIRGMSAREADAFDSSIVTPGEDGADPVSDLENFRAKLVVHCVVDKDGKRIFTDEDADVVGDLPADTIQLLFEPARRLCGMEKKAVDTEGKN